MKNKKIIFGDDGEVIKATTSSIPESNHIKSVKKHKDFRQKDRKPPHKTKSRSTKLGEAWQSEDDQKNENREEKWFEVYAVYNTSNDITELKEHELNELQKTCRQNFDNELPGFKKKNPSDAKWLETALYKGTARDQANAGALLVTNNPLGNLSTLETLIKLTKLSNKSSPEVVTVLTELFMEILLPEHRKLIPLTLRGADWKALKKNIDLSSEEKSKIYSYWHFENELKEHYFEFLKNLQQSLQAGQENNKNSAIIAASKLLTYAPEKEQMLLSMLINKLGDPSNKIASKALHHLSEVAFKHPNMCVVITSEAEKLIFRNNISESAQHFALCFLSQIAYNGNSDVCTNLVNICFALFKVLVKKGAVNNKTMQAILRCLQKAIVEAKPPPGSTEIMTKDMEDTIYRLVHLADIQISIQTLSLLLQLVAVKSESADRFYNALYKKLLDLNLVTLGMKAAAQFFHIVHRAIHIDQNVKRAQAFIKRLLQISLYLPAQMVCGSLIVINKLLKLRPELNKFEQLPVDSVKLLNEEDLAKFDSDGEEKYEDIPLDDEKNENGDNLDTEEKSQKELPDSAQTSSWIHAKNLTDSKDKEEQKVKSMAPTRYDPYHRSPAFAGAEFAPRVELVFLAEYFHPTAKVFAESIINHRKIDYYGDPLKDFSLTQFLERFAFKNPKKLDGKNEPRTPTQIMHKKIYRPHGGRAIPVNSLTKSTCTEDELFIFNYLEKKREKQEKSGKKERTDDDEDIESVGDDEFDNYLDSLCKKSKGDDLEDDEEFDIDYMKELETDLKDVSTKSKKHKKVSEGSDEEDGAEDDLGSDWDDSEISDIGEDDDSDNELDNAGETFSANEDDDKDGDSDIGLPSGSEEDISSDNDESDMEFDNEDEDSEGDLSDDEPPRAKKAKRMSSAKSFSKALKNKDDMSSLFAAADDFAELLEDTAKTKNHGTLNAVFNRDKASDKQLKWEEKRRSNTKFHKGNKKFKKSGKNKRK